MPPPARNTGESVQRLKTIPSGGFALVLRDRYLLLLAVLAVLLNCVNSTGEYILADLVLSHADTQAASNPAIDRAGVIAGFYSNFFFAINALTLVIQVGIVARLFRWIGVPGAILVLPVIALIGYGLVVFVPIFSVIGVVKILENSTDYSVMNTSRHALYLPLSTLQKFHGKTTIDTCFWRFGDVAQAAVIYTGLHWLGFQSQHFAMLNMMLALIWIAIAISIGRRYRRTER